MQSLPVVLLTGAELPLGALLADALLEHRYALALAVSKTRHVDALREAYRGKPALVGLVADSEAAAGFAKGAEDALGPITALLTTAELRSAHAVGREPSGELADLFAANLATSALLVRAVVGRMRRRQKGRILCFGRCDEATQSANEAACAGALRSYVRGLARELAGSGVDAAVLAVARAQDPPAELVVASFLSALASPALAEPLLPIGG